MWNLKVLYLRVPFLPTHTLYLRFAFKFKSFFPFGISTAPRMFASVSPLVSLLHQEGVRVHPYLADCLPDWIHAVDWL